MSQQNKTQIFGQQITITEPTVGKIRDWVASTETEEGRRQLDSHLTVDHIPITVFSLLTDWDEIQIDSLTLPQLREVLALLREKVPDFFAFLDPLIQAGVAAKKAAAASLNPSLST
ncbi:MAG: hypothetical protein HQL52_03915 [Magnetococcales bacterium]|nr:hypothetical protein [Magnetococcales bacterium]